MDRFEEKAREIVLKCSNTTQLYQLDLIAKALREGAGEVDIKPSLGKEFKKVGELVLDLLKNDERCRNDDKWLTYKVMRHYTNIYIPFDDFHKMPAFETIKRCRAKIQNVDHKFIATNKKVLQKRQQKQEFVRDWAKE